MTYCKECILPDTRPGIVIGADGVCAPCRNSKQKTHGIDWEHRELAFREVVKNAKLRSYRDGSGYDCLIPVSGGKDSTWQVVRCLEYGLNPLAVTWKTPARTELGQRNLDNLVRLGVDHIDYQVNPNVEKKFMYKGLVKYGSTAIPMHMAMFNIPLKIAVRFKIPLVIWGENTAFEYGGAEEERVGFKLTEKWLKQHGNTHATTAVDWLSEGLTARELTPYFGPTEAELDRNGVLAVFLGYYLGWDPEVSLVVASKHGFQARKEGPKTGYWNYADIDDDFIAIHHYIKWYKFGCTRLCDNLSVEIRNGRMTRAEAIATFKQWGEQVPHDDIDALCRFLDISTKHFFEVIETFRNLDIWFQEDGRWKLRDFLIKDWNWT